MLDAFVTAKAFGVRWLDTPARRNIAAWRARMAGRPSAKAMMDPLPRRIVARAG